MTYNNPFTPNPNNLDPVCSDATCTPCSSTPDPSGCFICGYPHNAFQDCRSQSTPCLDGSASCLDCESAFSNIKFLGGYVAGFNSKLGFGASESTVSIDLVVLKHDCQPTPSITCSTPPVCVNDVYTGQIGYVYTFSIGSFCFRGILNNHSYTEDSSGFKYKVNLSDGRSVLGGCSVLLNGFYSPIPDDLQPNLINIVRELEPSIYDDQCMGLIKCNDFTKSGASQKGIFLKKVIETLNGKCINIPISGAGLKLNLDRLINHINTQIRTTNQESTILEIIDLACQESGLGFFAQINNNNEIEIFPINYKIDINNTDLFQFVENLNNNNIVISKDYGQEMTLEKNKRVLYGAEYTYLMSVRDDMKNYCSTTDLYNDPSYQAWCLVKHAPWQQPDVMGYHPDYDSNMKAPQPTGC